MTGRDLTPIRELLAGVLTLAIDAHDCLNDGEYTDCDRHLDAVERRVREVIIFTRHWDGSG